jgi:hypothetical protein
MTYINNKSISTLTKIMEKHKSLSVQDLIVNLKLDSSEINGIYLKLHLLFMRTLRSIQTNKGY